MIEALMNSKGEIFCAGLEFSRPLAPCQMMEYYLSGLHNEVERLRSKNLTAPPDFLQGLEILNSRYRILLEQHQLQETLPYSGRDKKIETAKI